MMRARVSTWVWLGVAACTYRVPIFERVPVEGGTSADGTVDAAQPTSPDVALEGELDAEVTDAARPVPSRVTSLAAFAHTCVVAEATLYCWGVNDHDQLGLGSAPTAGFLPERVSDALYTQVCAGEEHGCALRESGTLECWGNNTQGQLGVGDLEPRSTPAVVSDLPRVEKLVCGGFNTCVVTRDAGLRCWGENHEGQAGQADGFDAPDVLTPMAAKLPGPVRDVSVGQGHVCALLESGALYCWGRNTVGQLGIDDPEAQVRVPTEVTPGVLYRSVSAALSHTCAIRDDGQLACWGDNRNGLLGRDAPRTAVYAPITIGAAADYIAVRVSWFHSCALRPGGQLWCWGRNIEGQLGLGDIEERLKPTMLAKTNLDAFVLGRFHTCAASGATLYCWGKNEDGELGIGPVGRKYEPTSVQLP